MACNKAISFANEIDFLPNVNQSKLRQFALFLEEKQILRCRGRINNSNIPPTNKNPILLPLRHPFVDLLIGHTHECVKHSTVTNMLTTLQESFWILKGRQAVFYSHWSRLCRTLVHQTKWNSRKGSSKCYVCLFTCASSGELTRRS